MIQISQLIFSMRLFNFLIFILLNQIIFSELMITKFQYRDMMILILKFKIKNLTVKNSWDFMILHFARILLSIWYYFINFTSWVTDEITDLNLIIFARSIKIISLSSLLQNCMSKICWNIYSIISSKQHFLISKIISIHELNTSQSSLTHELDI